MQYLAKAIAIYTNKKTEFDSKNNDKSGELVYFQLANSQFYFKFSLKNISYQGQDKEMPIFLRELSNNLPHYYLNDSKLLPIFVFFLSYKF